MGFVRTGEQYPVYTFDVPANVIGGSMTAREDATIINSLVRQALTSAQEVMGDNGLNAVLRTSGLERFIGNFPPEQP